MIRAQTPRRVKSKIWLVLIGIVQRQVKRSVGGKVFFLKKKKQIQEALFDTQVFLEKPADFRTLSGGREKKEKTGSLPAKPGELAGLLAQ